MPREGQGPQRASWTFVDLHGTSFNVRKIHQLVSLNTSGFRRKSVESFSDM
jgi:hypothetical protein